MMESFNLKNSPCTAYFADINAHYADPLYLIVEVGGSPHIIIMEKLKIRKKLNMKRRLRIYRNHLAKLFMPYYTLKSSVLRSKNCDVTTYTEAQVNSAIGCAWEQLSNSKIYLDYVESTSDFTFLKDGKGGLVMHAGNPIFIQTKINSALYPKYWAQKELIKVDPLLNGARLSPSGVPERALSYQKVNGIKYYKAYNRSWRYLRTKRRLTQQLYLLVRH